MDLPTFDCDGREIPFESGDSILLSLTRAGVHPNEGGTLCFGGDCPNCLCTVGGVSYKRACQTQSRPGLSVARHPVDDAPPLPDWSTERRDVPVDHRMADLVVVGGGESGRAAQAEALSVGRSVELFDAAMGQEVVGIYPGPLVVVRTDDGMVQVECAHIVIAAGAAEIHPVVPGSDLIGIWTPRAASLVLAAGIELANTVVVGDFGAAVHPRLDYDRVRGELVRFVGEGFVGEGFVGEGRVTAVITRTSEGEIETKCENVIVSLGHHPRTGLARMANFMDVEVVGDAGSDPTIPVCPDAGVICPCSNVTLEQLDNIYDRGFTHMELLKRGTLAGTGTCQGSVCTPYLRSFLADRGEVLQPPFTFRPMARQLTMDELAAGSHLPTLARTALDGVHRSLGARMDRMGGWWRPWTYGNTDDEYNAVRQRVSLGDVSTLGKMIVTGPDAEATLQRLFPTNVATIKPGRSRYVLMLNERGYVMDDGMIARERDDTFFLSFTSGGASMAEMWIRDWSTGWGHDIRILNQTLSLGAINVTGPRAAELLHRATDEELPPFLGHGKIKIAGVPCKIFRLSFTGEVSFELHHPAARSVELWNALMELGQDFGIAPHGIEALFRLRLEKGHIIVGQDTDFDATPRRLQHEWAVNMNKGDFMGRSAIERTNEIPLDRKLVGFETESRELFDGAVAWAGDQFAGTVSSSAWSPALGKGVALGWLESIDGSFPETVLIDGNEAKVVAPHFYDPEGLLARA